MKTLLSLRFTIVYCFFLRIVEYTKAKVDLFTITSRTYFVMTDPTVLPVKFTCYITCLWNARYFAVNA